MGGAIATGHPYAASGAAPITRLFNMEDKMTSIATMGIEEEWVMRPLTTRTLLKPFNLLKRMYAYCALFQQQYTGSTCIDVHNYGLILIYLASFLTIKSY